MRKITWYSILLIGIISINCFSFLTYGKEESAANQSEIENKLNKILYFNDCYAEETEIGDFDAEDFIIDNFDFSISKTVALEADQCEIQIADVALEADPSEIHNADVALETEQSEIHNADVALETEQSEIHNMDVVLDGDPSEIHNVNVALDMEHVETGDDALDAEQYKIIDDEYDISEIKDLDLIYTEIDDPIIESYDNEEETSNGEEDDSSEEDQSENEGHEHSFVKGICECGSIQDGFAFVDGEWRLYKNNEILNDSNGIVCGIISDFSDREDLYYVREGIFVKATGLTRYADSSNQTLLYVKKGVFTPSTGISHLLDSDDTGWYYVQDGLFSEMTGITLKANSKDQKWYYIQNGKYTKKTGLAKKADGSDSAWYYVLKGKFSDKTGITKWADGSVSGWFYVSNGLFTAANGIAQKAYSSDQNWYYISDGVYTKKSGLAKKADGSNNKWYYVWKGKLTQATGLAQKADGSNNKWYFVENGIYKKSTTAAKKADLSSKKIYYVENGKYVKLSDWKKLEQHWYYFENGKAFVGSKCFDGIVYTFDENGICLESSPYAAADDKAQSIICKIGTNLYDSFLYSASARYEHTDISGIGLSVLPGYCASFLFQNKCGSCYHMAASFYYLAKNLGLDAHMVIGEVPYAAGGIGPHCWVEIEANGATSVYDPQFHNQYGFGGYHFQYGDSGSWRYMNYQRIN